MENIKLFQLGKSVLCIEDIERKKQKCKIKGWIWTDNKDFNDYYIGLKNNDNVKYVKINPNIVRGDLLYDRGNCRNRFQGFEQQISTDFSFDCIAISSTQKENNNLNSFHDLHEIIITSSEEPTLYSEFLRKKNTLKDIMKTSIFNKQISTQEKVYAIEGGRVIDAEGVSLGLEYLFFKGNSLFLSGWVVYGECPLENAYIEVKNKFFKLKHSLKISISRDDVVQDRKLNNLLKPGISLALPKIASAPSEIKLSFKFKDVDYIFEFDLSEYLPIFHSNSLDLLFKFSMLAIPHFPNLLKNGLKNEISRLVLLSENMNNKEILPRVTYNLDKKPNTEIKFDYPVNIVIAAFNNLHLLEPLFQDLCDYTDLDCILTIVDDGSKREDLHKFYDKLEGTPFEHEFIKQINIIRREENCGFVKSTNAGLRLSEGHSVILNTDTRLPPKWLSKLMRPIYEDESICSVTPMTNGGTVASFPIIGIDNKLVGGLDVVEIDKFFTNLDIKKYIEVPSGVGFCMAMAQNFTKKYGILDEETFGRGYGEENDWCLRSAKNGGRNVIVHDLFVYHIHGATFKEEKRNLVEAHLKLINERYPDYGNNVSNFFNYDKVAYIRIAALLEYLGKYPDNGEIIIDHNLGGGANSYRKDKLEEALANGRIVILVCPITEDSVIGVEVHTNEGTFTAIYDSLETLFVTVQNGTKLKIIVNNLVSYNDLNIDLKCLRHLFDKGANIEYLVHDFYAICPSYTLLNNEGKFCNVPDLISCNLCFNNGIKSLQNQVNSIETWRNNWSDIISKSTIKCFSYSSETIVKRAFGEELNVIVEPHKVKWLSDLESQKSKTMKSYDDFKIGILGGINFEKGRDKVLEISQLLEQKYPEAKIVIVGVASPKINARNIFETGSYNPLDLPDIISNNKLDVFLLPSICPETFSFTTSELMSLGLGVACYNIGAPPERVRNYEFGVIIDNQDAENTIETLFELKNKRRDALNNMN